MFNREYHVRANREGRAKLQGEQQRLAFPRRGRPSKFRRLERAGQMRLGLHGVTKIETIHATKVQQTASSHAVESDAIDDIDSALQMTFPVGPLSELELEREFNRLFPPEA
jgi:hypothetical protein